VKYRIEVFCSHPIGVFVFCPIEHFGFDVLSPSRDAFMAIGISNGKLVFSFSGTRMATMANLADGVAHNVYLEKDAKQLSLQVDGKPKQVAPVQNLIDWREIKDQDLFMGAYLLNKKIYAKFPLNIHWYFFKGGLPGDIFMTTGGLYAKGFAGCIHSFKVHNHLSQNAPDQTKKRCHNNPVYDIYIKIGLLINEKEVFPSYGSTVDFSDPHLNHNSQGVVSSQECSLPPAPTPRPPYQPASSTPRPAITTTKTTTTTTKRSSTPRPPFKPVTTTTKRPPRVKRDLGKLQKIDT
jgi:hypothetical protein